MTTAPVTSGELAAFEARLVQRIEELRRPLAGEYCQKCGLVAGIVIGFTEEINGALVGRAAWCCPRCVIRTEERIEELEQILMLKPKERIRAAAVRLRERFFRPGRGWSDELDIADLVAAFSGEQP